jgi:signal peptidase
MFWKALSIVAESHSPIVVVLSGSMEPAFQRGDILFLWNREEQVKVGDVVVYEVPGKPIPIVHRVLREHVVDISENDQKKQQSKQNKLKKNKKGGVVGKAAGQKQKQLLLTKGDNNAVDDLGLYNHNQNYLDRNKDVVGVVKGYFPKVGYVTLLLTENQYFKYALLGLMGVSTLLYKDQ